MIAGRNIICLASSWEIDPTSKHQIMRRLAARNRVLWVNYHGSRMPKPNRQDFARILETMGNVARGTSRPMNGVTTLTPMLLPLPGSSVIRGVNARLVAMQIRRAMRDWPEKPLQIWSFAPDVGELLDHFDSEAVVYCCVDEFSAFEGYDGPLIRRLERDTIARSDLVLTTSERLFQNKRGLHPETHLLRHGVDTELFGQAFDENTPVPEIVRDLPRPVIGYFGLIDDWLDVSLIGRVAALRPEWSFVLIGGIKCDVSQLRKQSNVLFTGRVDQSMLPGFCRAFDVAVIPFVMNELTRNANPIKLREYLAAGLGVVSTPLPEVQGYEPFVLTADSPETFAASCEQVLAANSPDRSRARAEAVAHEHWDGRIEKISALVEGVCRGNVAAVAV